MVFYIEFSVNGSEQAERCLEYDRILQLQLQEGGSETAAFCLLHHLSTWLFCSPFFQPVSRHLTMVGVKGRMEDMTGEGERWLAGEASRQQGKKSLYFLALCKEWLNEEASLGQSSTLSLSSDSSYPLSTCLFDRVPEPDSISTINIARVTHLEMLSPCFSNWTSAMQWQDSEAAKSAAHSIGT